MPNGATSSPEANAEPSWTHCAYSSCSYVKTGVPAGVLQWIMRPALAITGGRSPSGVTGSGAGLVWAGVGA